MSPKTNPTRRRLSFRKIVHLGAACLAVAGALANDGDPGTKDPRREPTGRSFDAAKGWTMALSPASDLYPRYIADPRRSNFTLLSVGVSESEVSEAGDSRVGLRLGGRYGFLRFHRNGDPDRGFQIDIEGGFIGQFDRDHSTDNIGWDGIYGIQLAWAGRRGLAARLGLFHDSSHVGDEHAERTGRQRINYTRREIVAGVSRSFAGRWRAYLEAAYADDLRNEELMQPWRVQYGLEYEAPPRLWGRRLGWYAAADVSSFQENDWDDNRTLQIGVVFPVGELSRSYRFGVEHYDGRSWLGEFFQNEERYLAFGFWFEL